MRYAIINNGVVENVAVAESPIDENWIECDGLVQAGWLYSAESSFTAPPEPEKPNRVRITGLTKGGVDQIAVARRIIITEGTALGVTARFETAAGDLIQLTDSFAVPIYQVGGIVDQSVGANFIDGIAQLMVTFSKSGEYVVNEQGLNMHLPEGSKLSFDDLFISVIKS